MVLFIATYTIYMQCMHYIPQASVSYFINRDQTNHQRTWPADEIAQYDQILIYWEFLFEMLKVCMRKQKRLWPRRVVGGRHSCSCPYPSWERFPPTLWPLARAPLQQDFLQGYLTDLRLYRERDWNPPCRHIEAFKSQCINDCSVQLDNREFAQRLKANYMCENMVLQEWTCESVEQFNLKISCLYSVCG